MKPMAYSRYKYSADFYKFVLENLGSEQMSKYYFVGKLSLTAGLDLAGRLTIRCNQPIPINSLLANVKDSNGELILDDQIWQITGLEPINDAFNSVNEYRMRAVKFQGEL